MNVTFSKVKFFTIIYSINHPTQLQDILHIVIITDAIFATIKIFDLNIYSQQLHSITISKNLRVFFKKNSNNSINF